MILVIVPIIISSIYIAVFWLGNTMNKGSRGSLADEIIHTVRFAIYGWILAALLISAMFYCNFIRKERYGVD